MTEAADIAEPATAPTLADALAKMQIPQTRVRRGGQVAEVDAADLVPGGIVLIESGDNSDKTGTLTMNAMTVSSMYAGGRWYRVQGSGYAKAGAILGVAGSDLPDFTPLALGLSLCSDATVADRLVGIIDPLRPTAPEAVHVALGTGIDVRMITGDHTITARAIADQLDLGPGVTKQAAEIIITPAFVGVDKAIQLRRLARPYEPPSASPANRRENQRAESLG